MSFFHQYIFKIFLLSTLYYFTGKLSLSFSQDEGLITIVYFVAEGIALASVLLYGRNMWLGIFIGQFLLAIDTGVMIVPALMIASINSINSLIGLVLFKYFKLNKNLEKIRDIVGLVCIISLVLQPISAIFGNIVLAIFSITEWQSYIKNTLSWWFGNTMGQFLVTPFILLIHHNFKEFTLRDVALNTLLFGAISYIILIIFPIKTLAIITSITIPMVVVVSAYKNISIAYSSAIIFAIISLYSIQIGAGPFSTRDSINNIIDLNFFVFSHIFIVLVIGTLFQQQKIYEEKLKSMSMYDFLTGLPNRNLLSERLHHVIAMAHRYQKNSAICFIDIDGFKYVNDTYGHSIGDIVLKKVVSRIGLHIREEDSLIRLGGDEFLIILEGMEEKKDIVHFLDRISRDVNKPILIDDKIINVSLSIGISICPVDGDTVVDLMSHSDNAMYKAKENGKNCFVFYS